MSIAKEIDDRYSSLVDLPASYIDFDGARIQIDPSDEEIGKIQEISFLIDLTRLKSPALFSHPPRNMAELDCGDDWGQMANAQMCPCPGVVLPDDDEDPLGDWHGRNV